MRRLMMSREPHVVQRTSVQNSIKKISVDYKKTTDDLLKSKGKYIQRVLENLDSTSSVESRIEADHLITRCIHVRNSTILRVNRCLTKLSKKCEVVISKLGEVSIKDNVQFSISILCGKALHHPTSGPYFFETAYNPEICRQTKEQNTDTQLKSSKKLLVMDNEGKITNVLPVCVKPGKSNSTWICDKYCRSVDVDILRELKYLFNDLVVQKYSGARDFFRHIDECSSAARHPNKRGHPISCFTEPLPCKSRFLKLNILSYHSSFLRTVKRIIYEIRHLYEQIKKIGHTLEQGNLTTLREIQEEAKKIVINCRTREMETCLDETELAKRYMRGIKEFTNIDQDPPCIPCISCERLCTFVHVQVYRQSRETHN
ncbi:hypothetical protein QAD02_012958 [Eretmocerus hayati]|uniref:Uncharacterized protein n=1 Tax=Eretmocerus hayati TaxID=131215 RepID=A0ACC2P2Y0_9HYME|nr:hypothetical protein QAD02_012958 [Eretmocerus hayati]